MHGHMHTWMQTYICRLYIIILYPCSRLVKFLHISRSVIFVHAVVASLLKEGLATKDIFYYSPAISFKKILFEQLNNKPWTAVNRCAGILAQHGKAEYVEALISRCLGYCVHSSACTRVYVHVTTHMTNASIRISCHVMLCNLCVYAM